MSCKELLITLLLISRCANSVNYLWFVTKLIYINYFQLCFKWFFKWKSEKNTRKISCTGRIVASNTDSGICAFDLTTEINDIKKKSLTEQEIQNKTDQNWTVFATSLEWNASFQGKKNVQQLSFNEKLMLAW